MVRGWAATATHSLFVAIFGPKWTPPMAIGLVILKWVENKGLEQLSCCLIAHTKVSKETQKTHIRLLFRSLYFGPYSRGAASLDVA